MQKHGSPTRNGLGHRRGKDLKGTKCVIVPESNCMRRKHIHLDKAVLERVIDDGKNEAFAGQAERKFRSTASALQKATEKTAPSAVGVAASTLDHTGSFSSTSRRTSLPADIEKGVVSNGRRSLKRKSSNLSTSDGDGEAISRSQFVVSGRADEETPSKKQKKGAKATAKSSTQSKPSGIVSGLFLFILSWNDRKCISVALC